jgi:hypothetical protein
MHRNLGLRVTAGLAGIALLAAAVFGAFLVPLFGAMSAKAPDPFVPNGDPCCGHPDTWGEVAAGVGWTLTLAAVAGLVACLAVLLLVWAASGRWMSLRRLATVPVAAVIATGSVLAVIIAPLRDEGRTPPDCDHFTFTRAAWQSADRDAHLRMAYGVAQCDVVDGRSASEVATLLGRPSSRGDVGDREYWSYDGLDVFLVDRRVADAETSP